MYENYTYEFILKSILDRISTADSSIDIREGSPIWYAVSPVAVELAIAYSNYDMVRKESFVGTATRDGLYRACEDIGLDTEQFEANNGVFTAHFNNEVSLNSRWSCGGYIFYVTSKVGMVEIEGLTYHQYHLTCETTGSLTQYTSGNLLPITDYGDGRITVAVLDECVIVGEDETTDDEIRKYYFDAITNNATDGNVAQYNQWLSEIDGVGAHKVTPLWNGANTVRVAIIDENGQAPTPELIVSVQSQLDPGATGLGEGKAPIGAVVTVIGGTNALIDVRADITLVSENADYGDITEKLESYFKEIAFKKSAVNIYEVASIILSSDAVSDVSGVALGKFDPDTHSTTFTSSNLPLDEFEVPVLHTFETD